jgi:hypothetical protein
MPARAAIRHAGKGGAVVSRESKKFLKQMGELSAGLQRIGERAGVERGEFIKLVDRVADKRKLRRWCDTQSPVDYLMLADAVKEELGLS